MYKSITGKRTDEADPPLLRVPASFRPKAVRVFVATYLPKVSEWLFKHGQERDIELLKKLSSSEYNTSKTRHILPDPDKKELYQEHARNKQMCEFTTRAIADKNRDSDWGTVKSSKLKRVSVRMRK